ncbi:MAG: hypothetical protein FWE13_03175 [Firmicutes bacterium]|nr:hypothetical protein [Bacillota bacterium]
MVAIIICIGLVTTFTIIRGGSSNEGRIRGLDGGRFVMHNSRTLLEQAGTGLITSREELVEMYKATNRFYDWDYHWKYDYEWEYRWQYYQWRHAYDWLFFWNKFFEDHLNQYDDTFFENNHLVIVCGLTSLHGETFSVRRMSYQNGVLDIEFRRHRRSLRGAYLNVSSVRQTVFIEIPAICIGLEIRARVRNPHTYERNFL